MVELLYVGAAVLFILGLKQLSSPRTARRGNLLASGGMLLAIIVTLVDTDIISWGAIIAGLLVGGVIGAMLALRVQMTAMPQLVAAFHSLVGMAAVFASLACFLKSGQGEMRSFAGAVSARISDTPPAVVRRAGIRAEELGFLTGEQLVDLPRDEQVAACARFNIGGTVMRNQGGGIGNVHP